MASSSESSRSVVILGGGIIGCSVAYQLTLRGYKPIIVDRELAVATGASGKAGGFLARHWSDEYVFQCLFQLLRPDWSDFTRVLPLTSSLLLVPFV